MTAPAPRRVLVVEDNGTVRRFAVDALREAGYETHEASDLETARAALAEADPEVVVVDASLPDGEGEALCAELRDGDPARPSVLTSARHGALDADALDRSGASFGLAKPFTPPALLRAVARALGGDRASSESGAMRLVDMERSDAHEAAVAILVDALGDVAARVDLPGEALAGALRAELGLEDALALGRRLSALTPGRIGEPSFEGRIDHVPLADVLQLVELRRLGGVLELWDDYAGHVLELCFRDGLLDAVVSRGLATDVFRLGRFLAREGVRLPEEAGRRGLVEGSGPLEVRRLGRRLVEAGEVDEDTLRRAVAAQAEALVHEGLRWDHGGFRFHRHASRPEASEARLGLTLGPMILEGVRRADEWRHTLARVGGLDQVLDWTDAGDPGREGALGEAVDGARSVREVFEAASAGDPLETLRALAELSEAGRLRRAAGRGSPPGPA